MAIRKRIAMAWRIAFTGRGLKQKMRLMIYMSEYYRELIDEVQGQSTEAGQLHTLQALRELVKEREDDVRHQSGG